MKRKTVILLFLVLAMAMLAGCGMQTEKTADAGMKAEINTLTFSAASLTQDPTFVDWTQDGTVMQLIDQTGGNREGSM